jgi:hypothetical protein
VLIDVLVEVLAVLLRGNECRACKHHQQKDGCNNLSHGENLTRKTAGELCPVSSPQQARPARRRAVEGVNLSYDDNFGRFPTT